ncbi:hypothetical protein TWF281_005601 [Arthrobotrys megalospora]
MADPSLQPSYTTFQGNKITSPGASSTLTPGKPFIVQWSNITGPPDGQITLYLLNFLDPKAKKPSDLERWGRIATTDNTGSYRWHLYASIPDGDRYVIETSYDSWPGNYSYSEPFAIMGAGPNPPTLPAEGNAGLTWGTAGTIAAASFSVIAFLAAAGISTWYMTRRMRRKAAERREKEARQAQEAKLGGDESRGTSIDAGDSKC